jgi:hypothetical protein
MSKAPLTIIRIVALTVLGTMSASGQQWTGSMTDSAGVQIVTNTRQGMWRAGSGWTVEEILRIGTIDEEPEYQFGEIGWLTPGSDGSIYVLDIQGQHVKVFSPSGEYLRTIGGPGSGPGEMGIQNPGQAFVLLGLGDTVFVPDNANQRVNRWTSAGDDAGSFPLDFLQGIPFIWGTLPNGALVQQLRPLSFTDGAGTPGEGSDYVLLLNTDGNVMDTVVSFPSGKTLSFTGGIPEWTIYTPETGWTITEEGHVLLGRSDEYRLHEHDASGDLIRVISMPWEPRLVSERDKDAVRDFFERILREQPQIPPDFVQQLIDNNVHFGEYLPAFNRTVIGPNGTTWVQHVRAAAEMTDEQLASANFIEDIGAPEWDVLDRSGRFLGVVTMPDRFAPREIVGDKIYGVWRDEWDVQYAMVLKIVGAGVN